MKTDDHSLVRKVNPVITGSKNFVFASQGCPGPFTRADPQQGLWVLFSTPILTSEFIQSVPSVM